MGERKKETAYIQDNKTKITVPICALGGSIATAKTGLTAEVIEVHSIKELAELGVDKIKGKIVFFNRPMNNEEIESFMRIQGLVIREILVLVKQQSLSCRTIVRSLNLRLTFLTGAHRVMQSRNRNTFLQQP
jgi:hypothetical protein